jgi:hypothetical protein
MRRNKVNFEFNKDFGTLKKGAKKVFNIPFATKLQTRKVGKMIKPREDKADKEVENRQTK